MKKKDKKAWPSDMTEEDSEGSEWQEDRSGEFGTSKSKQLLLASMEEVDQELERLKEDALPERKKSTSKSCCEAERQKGQAQVS